MKSIQSNCCLCGKPAVASFEDDAMPEAVDKWLAMLAHDRCSDLKRKFNDSGDAIVKWAFTYGQASPSEKGKIIDNIRRLLLVATRQYSESLAGILNAPKAIWTQDFVDLILGNPEKIGRILYNYREQVRASIV